MKVTTEHTVDSFSYHKGRSERDQEILAKIEEMRKEFELMLNVEGNGRQSILDSMQTLNEISVYIRLTEQKGEVKG